MQQVCMPTDPSAAMIQSSGSYIFHLAFALIIAFRVEYTYDFMCWKQAEEFIGLPTTKDSWVQTFPDPDIESPDLNESFVNSTMDHLLWMHICCFVLLFLS